MPLARHDREELLRLLDEQVSTHMPLARHDKRGIRSYNGTA